MFLEGGNENDLLAPGAIEGDHVEVRIQSEVGRSPLHRGDHAALCPEPTLCAGLVALTSAARAAAQDTHCWAIQYGPVGQLVGGQLIGGVTDLSATFYNPGALSLRNESSYLLSTESVQWESVSTEPQSGVAVFDTSSSNFGSAPSLLAGVLPRWLGKDTRLAWSFLTRQNLDMRLGQRITDPVAGAAASAGNRTSTRMWRRTGPSSRSRDRCRTP